MVFSMNVNHGDTEAITLAYNYYYTILGSYDHAEHIECCCACKWVFSMNVDNHGGTEVITLRLPSYMYSYWLQVL